MSRRNIAVVFVVGLVLVLGSSLATTKVVYAGGGGCPEPQSDARGTTVDVKEFCMLPTVLRVDAGTTITWKNWDEVPHTVTGAGVRSGREGAGSWGSFEQLAQNQTYSHTFTESGVFPYYCMLHPGMVGAVVVGDGVAKEPYPPGGPANTTASGPTTQSQTQAEKRSAATRASMFDGTFIAVLATFGLAIGVGAAITLYRLRTSRRSPIGPVTR
jgi:plastocyanin